MTDKTLTFEEYVEEINKLAIEYGWAKPDKPYCEAECWRDPYEDGLTPDDAWYEEVYCAQASI